MTPATHSDRSVAVEGVDMVDAIPMADRDTNGDLYEYLLSKIANARGERAVPPPRTSSRPEPVEPGVQEVVVGSSPGQPERGARPRSHLKDDLCAVGVEGCYAPAPESVGASQHVVEVGGRESGFVMPGLFAIDALG